ncbi:iron chelate uptake ABC transporter, FeCT family, permease protein [Oribacterium sp. oral taxon 078 str. F0263]|uniref:FecCD family ABC transporter permease n=1 Tax=Oribacterium sp. oral taxon 078 TaxID=652706 RepID=UPI0003ADFEFF|nr:iron ABC transporter permease [Oribacterium sp. oral taxon 078]ERL22302.1 iron chelate uptake ABC transporter, FeCT family, permease protein [Oribacterium sp. oral taxon 078 str. F0263]
MERKLLLRNGAFRPWAIAAMLLLPPLIAVFCCGFGRMSLPPAKLIETAFLTLTGRDADPQARAVIFELRIPRILMAIAVGGGLGCAGAACQALFSNPLATPDILGVTSGTCVGAILAILLSFNMAGIQATALLFGLFSVFVTLRLSSGKRGISILFLVLSGVMISSLFNALSSLLKYTADPMDKLPQITYWLMGSFTGASYRKLLIGSPMILIGTALIYLLRWQFNILSLSEDEARASGIHLKRMRILLVLAITMITASSVSMCGQVGWVGLLIPHCARMMTGSNNRLVIPMSISLGASFLILIDTLSRTLTVIELPLSVLTAILGAPFFILLLKRSERSFR